ncbi:hypothetical protein WJX74_005948 [Apatococcus lobatus]|uniref:Uncharacterized protein n=1 Tax=Apatococcus lobatus TaxID=904363 RepID=A0AAW1S002_9CHLO
MFFTVLSRSTCWGSSHTRKTVVFEAVFQETQLGARRVRYPAAQVLSALLVGSAMPQQWASHVPSSSNSTSKGIDSKQPQRDGIPVAMLGIATATLFWGPSAPLIPFTSLPSLAAGAGAPRFAPAGVTYCWRLSFASPYERQHGMSLGCLDRIRIALAAVADATDEAFTGTVGADAAMSPAAAADLEGLVLSPTSAQLSAGRYTAAKFASMSVLPMQYRINSFKLFF